VTDPSPAPAASPAPAETARAETGSWALFLRLWRGYLSPYRWRILAAFAMMVVEGSTLAVLSWMLEPLFDRVFVGGDADAIWWVGGGILALFVIRAVTSVVSKTMLMAVSLRVSAALQVDLLRHLLTLDLRFFQTYPPGALIERVQGDTLAVQSVWSAVIVGVGRDAIALVALFAVAVAIDPVWTLAALVGAPALVLPGYLVQRYIRRKTGAVREQAADRATRLDEVFHGIATVKLNRMEPYQTARFGRILDGIVDGEVRMEAGRAAVPALIDIITGIGFFAVLMLGGREIIAGERTVGEFMSFFTAMALAFQPMRRLGGFAGIWQVAAASLERIWRLFDEPPPARPAARPAAIPVVAAPVRRHAPEIRVEGLHLSYAGQPVLRGLDFTAPAGGRTAIVGPSGAGKSTVFHALTALAQPSSGRILIGGTDTATMDLATLRDLFAVVSQDAWLFDETLRDNIAPGRSDLPDAALAAALAAANADDFVARMPLGLMTRAGPRGSALSGGQRQRIAIARALLRDAPVLLMDEATSALDAASEALVTEALERLSAGRTTLVIAHRLATVQGADHIVVLDGGRAVDQGRHAELVARGGLYAELCRLQFDGRG
jgi:ATP-binding cassette subfamily B protein/subfamily B ATP-binding cassette protein MsbA